MERSRPYLNKRQNAQSMVEFALVLPVLLLLVYGLLEAGRLIFIYSTVVTASREAARYGSASGVTSGTVQYNDCAGIRAAAQKVDFLDSFTDAQIVIQYDHGPDSGGSGAISGYPAPFASCPPTTVETNDRIVVQVTAQFTPIVNIVPIGPLTIRSANARTLLGKVSILGASVPPAPLPDTNTLTVVNGGGSGTYPENTNVTIIATIPADKVFDQWTGDIGYLADPMSSSTTLTMPATNVTVTATFKDPTIPYTLTVVGGSGSGSYFAGTVVTIEAAVPAGKVFVQWTGATGAVANLLASPTTLTMPAADTTVTATFADAAIPTHVLTVVNGTGSGTYPEGTSVTITATIPPSKIFDQWTGDVSTVDDHLSASTTVIIPTTDMTVTATFKDPVPYVLTVANGTGSGTYYPGTIVIITATIPADKVFDKWTGDVGTVANVTSSSTTVVMPEANTSITATFKDPTYICNSTTVTHGSVTYTDTAAYVTITNNTGTSLTVSALSVAWDTSGSVYVTKAQLGSNVVIQNYYASPYSVNVSGFSAIPTGTSTTFTVTYNKTIKDPYLFGIAMRFSNPSCTGFTLRAP